MRTGHRPGNLENKDIYINWENNLKQHFFYKKRMSENNKQQTSPSGCLDELNSMCTLLGKHALHYFYLLEVSRSVNSFSIDSEGQESI